MNLVISGPTATGKSDLAIKLAKELGGEIINLDSVQIYKGLDIGSGKLKLDKREGIPHHLIDVCEPSTIYNAATFVREAREVSADIRSRGKLPILCGGTTMWLSLFVHGLASLPSADPKIREELSKLPNEEIIKQLELLDFEAAKRININDRKRLERSLEASLISNKSQSDHYSEHNFKTIEEPCLIIVLLLARDELYRRIDLRTQGFFRDGIINEASGLYKKYGRCIALKSLSYPEAISISEENLTLDEGLKLAQQKTRRYAKRQITFWRNEPEKRGWHISPTASEAEMLDIGETTKPVPAYRWSYSMLREIVSTELEILNNKVKIIRLDAAEL